MGTTANYSWPTPVATDLVKDGWEAIKDLGDAADTTVKAVSDAQGLIHIETQTFSAVSAVSFSNVLTSDYKYFRVMVNGTASGAGIDLRLRFRSSTTDRTANYYSAAWVFTFASGTDSKVSNNAGFIPICAINANEFFVNFDISGLVSAKPTVTGRSMGDAWAGAASFGGLRAVSETNNGFTLLTSSGTMTGEASVYGYKG